MQYCKYIAIEGPIGTGKTSLAQVLAEEIGARLILEEADANPFLPDFYRNSRRYALQTQLCFLLSRHRQQIEIKQINIFRRTVVTDYIFEKDRIFAHLTLDERELELYHKVADLLAYEVPTPDRIIYLQASPERLLTNIRIRDIEYERLINIQYLRDLCESYNRFFFNWDRSDVLFVNVSQMDFVNNDDHRQQLLEVIKGMPAGRTFFNPEA